MGKVQNRHVAFCVRLWQPKKEGGAQDLDRAALHTGLPGSLPGADMPNIGKPLRKSKAFNRYRNGLCGLFCGDVTA